jgi:1,4-alpha-glucan branching enzyme
VILQDTDWWEGNTIRSPGVTDSGRRRISAQNEDPAIPLADSSRDDCVRRTRIASGVPPAPMMRHEWRPTLGAWLEPRGVRFRVWAPDANELRVVFERPGPDAVPLARFSDGTFGALVTNAKTGDRYRYAIDDGRTFPDPASRFQPEGVHGPSEIVDPRRFSWTDNDWAGIRRSDLVLYELHIGTFTPEGTFAAAAERLPYLARAPWRHSGGTDAGR